ncbi:unnamed protein product [Larinioides sclopetarius]|uniref:Aspartyl/asparaginy/proline hydroxylase domain-containing protein n=1 Tax=Larinioides sclopetarius TaxID=280406 RepID=A0AAV1ZFB2_9ARAC
MIQRDNEEDWNGSIKSSLGYWLLQIRWSRHPDDSELKRSGTVPLRLPLAIGYFRYARIAQQTIRRRVHTAAPKFAITLSVRHHQRQITGHETLRPSARTWEEGKVILFDDSFEHEVWHNGTVSRLVLIVDFWHPELTAYQKRSLTPI